MLQGKGVGIVLLAIALGALAWGCRTWWWEGVIDDAYITFRYSRNLSEGIGPVFNAGDRVEGYSNPSWMLLMAGSILVGIDPVSSSKWLGLSSGLALLVVLYAALRRKGASGLGGGLAALLLGASPLVQVATVSGLETVAYSLLLFLGAVLLSGPNGSWRVALGASACLGAAALTRPEGIAFWGAGLACALFWSPDPTDPPTLHRARTALPYVAPALAVAAHLAWRTAYYGSYLPNTYHTNSGGGIAMVQVGITELGEFLSNPAHAIWAALAVLGSLVGARWGRRRRDVVVMGGLVILQLCFLLSVGGDYIFIHRFYVPLLAPLAFLVGLLHVQTHPEGRAVPVLQRLGLAAIVVALMLGARFSATHYVPRYGRLQSYLQGNEKLGRYLARNRDPGTVIATGAAGAIPYYSGLRTIDIFGLNDVHIARLPFPNIKANGLVKWDAAYVVSQRPDIIVINRGYVPPGDPRADAIARTPDPLLSHQMDVDLFREVLRTGDYFCHSLDFGDGSVFWVFERKSRESGTSRSS